LQEVHPNYKNTTLILQISKMLVYKMVLTINLYILVNYLGGFFFLRTNLENLTNKKRFADRTLVNTDLESDLQLKLNKNVSLHRYNRRDEPDCCNVV
jgi:hypothetical protein